MNPVCAFFIGDPKKDDYCKREGCGGSWTQHNPPAVEVKVDWNRWPEKKRRK